jgi:hypothetical protein
MIPVDFFAKKQPLEDLLLSVDPCVLLGQPFKKVLSSFVTCTSSIGKIQFDYTGNGFRVSDQCGTLKMSADHFKTILGLDFNANSGPFVFDTHDDTCKRIESSSEDCT